MYATIGSHTFQGGAEPSLFTLSKMHGWWGGGEFRHDQQQRPTADGDFDAPVYRAGRIITLEGQVHATSDTQFENAIATLEDLLGDGSAGTLTVYQANGTYTIEVRRHGGLNLEILAYGRLARYQLQLWAPNPEKVEL